MRTVLALCFTLWSARGEVLKIRPFLDKVKESMEWQEKIK